MVCSSEREQIQMQSVTGGVTANGADGDMVTLIDTAVSGQNER